jgi:hypothetical protein
MQNVPELALPSNRLGQVVNRRSFVIGSAAAAASLVTTAGARPADLPSTIHHLINPFPSGGAADLVGRPFAAMLEPLIKQPVVIETKTVRRARSAPNSLPSQSPTATRSSSTSYRFRASPRSTSCSGGSRSSRAPTSYRSRASRRGRCC